MKLKKKIFAAISLTFLCSAVVLYAFTSTIVLGSFNELEKQSVQTNVTQALNALEEELSTIRSIGGDWGPWDDTRDFLLGVNEKYIEVNLPDSTLANLKLNFMLFIHSSGKVAHKKWIDLTDGLEKPMPETLIDHVASHKFLLKHASPKDHKTGIILLPESPVLLSSWPISNSDWKGPIHGTLIIGRYFGEQEIKNLSGKTRLAISLDRVNSSSMPAGFRTAAPLSENLPIHVKELSKDTIAGFTEYKDIYGNPCFTLTVKSPRNILKHGKESTYYFLIVLFLVGVIILIVLLIVIQLLVLSPLTKLTEHTSSIGISGDLSKRLSMRRGDEIGELSREFDNMLEQLMKSNNDLKDEIHERIRAEEESSKLQLQLLRAQKMEAIGTLAGGVAHDLNNILSGIMSYPELLLLDIPQDSPLRDPILTIKKSGEKAAAIVQDLLTLARRGVSVSEVVNLNDIILDYLNSPEYNQLQSFHPQVQIEASLDKNLLNIEGSPIHLSETVMNLVSNAAEAILDEGEVWISTENRYIDRPIGRYEKIEAGDYVVLAVHDNGSGIDPEDLEKIFEPFYTKKVMGRSGTGLGMAVVWGTIKDHNGYIDVQSETGKGTTLTLYFPVTRKKSETAKSRFPLEEYLGKGETVLIVDDREEQREVASAMLRRLNYSVTSVASGEEAIDYLKNNFVDLLLLDMIMDPGIDGLDTYKQILELNPMQKAIIASGFSETDRVKKIQKLGARKYLKKPYTLENIAIAMREALTEPETPSSGLD